MSLARKAHATTTDARRQDRSNEDNLGTCAPLPPTFRKCGSVPRWLIAREQDRRGLSGASGRPERHALIGAPFSATRHQWSLSRTLDMACSPRAVPSSWPRQCAYTGELSSRQQRRQTRSALSRSENEEIPEVGQDPPVAFFWRLEAGTSFSSGTFAGCVLAGRAGDDQLMDGVVVTVVVRSIPSVSVRCGTQVARPARISIA
jgi:hypothetical protein